MCGRFRGNQRHIDRRRSPTIEAAAPKDEEKARPVDSLSEAHPGERIRCEHSFPACISGSLNSSSDACHSIQTAPAFMLQQEATLQWHILSMYWSENSMSRNVHFHCPSADTPVRPCLCSTRREAAKVQDCYKERMKCTMCQNHAFMRLKEMVRVLLIYFENNYRRKRGSERRREKLTQGARA